MPINSFSPGVGTTGDVIVILGSGLALTTSVDFGSITATSTTVISDTEVHATVGSGESGFIGCRDSGGILLGASLSTFTFVPPEPVDNSMPRESKFSAIQVARIYLRATNLINTIARKIKIGSILSYETQPTFTSGLDIPNIDFVNSIIANAVTINVTSSDPSPYVMTGISTILSLFTSVPTIIARENQGSGVIKWRSDIQPVLDTVADTLTIDFGYQANGDITIKS